MKYKVSLLIYIFGLILLPMAISASSVDDIPNNYFTNHGSMCDSCTNNYTDVLYLQQLLNTDNQISVNIVENGDWGTNTKNAVKIFQSYYSLSPVDGWVGSTSKSKLDEILQRLKGESISLPSKPILTSPGILSSLGEDITDKTPTLNWSTTSNTTHYWVAVKDVTTNELVLNKNNIIGTSLTTPRLTVGHKYYWDITACNDTGCGEWSKSLYFKIADDSGDALSPVIDDIEPNVLLSSTKNIEIHGENFVAGSRVKWQTSSGNSGTLSTGGTTVVNDSQINITLSIGSGSTWWEFKVVTPGSKESGWKRVNVQIDGSGGDTPSSTNFLHFPLDGNHTSIGISSIFDHDSGANVKTFDGSVGLSSIKRNSTSSCYGKSSGGVFNLPGVKYEGVSNQRNYLCYNGHTGIDYKVADHTPVYAAANGMVVAKDNSPTTAKGGCTVVINHGNGYASAYMHMECNGRINLGSVVKQGDFIGYSGHTSSNLSLSSHLHFEVRKGCVKDMSKECSAYGNPNVDRVDPYGYKGTDDLWVDWSYDGSVTPPDQTTKTTIHKGEAENNYGGLTIITHGLYADTNDWVKEMGDAISKKQFGHTVHVYRLKFNGTEIEFTKIAGSHTQKADSLIVLVDWAESAKLLQQNDAERYIAQKSVQYLKNNNFSNKFFQLPIHLIGHSRGGSVVSHIAKEFGGMGIVIDQLTMLDPHPMDKSDVLPIFQTSSPKDYAAV